MIKSRTHNTQRAAASVVLAALLLVLLLSIACGDDAADEPQPTTTTARTAASTPTAAATAAATAPADAEQPGAEGFRGFAADLDAAVRAADAAFINERLRTRQVVCTEEDVTATPGGPNCSFPGETFEGFEMSAWRSEGRTVNVSAVEQHLSDRFFAVALPAETDEFGDGRPQVYAINASGDTYAALLTAIIERPPDFAGEGPLRVAIHTAWQYEDGRWLMTRLMNAYVLAEEFLRPDDVVSSYYPNWERFTPGPE